MLSHALIVLGGHGPSHVLKALICGSQRPSSSSMMFKPLLEAFAGAVVLHDESAIKPFHLLKRLSDNPLQMRSSFPTASN